MSNDYLKHLINIVEKNIFERCTHLLTLADRDKYSNSFGCFDRAFWQYKIKDFSSGMSQEAIYPLALALKNKVLTPKTTESQILINELIKSAAIYSLINQNGNGSVDDYFPYEQASGATAFSAYALINCLEMGTFEISNKYHVKFKKRLFWLSNHYETGRLSNHEALIALVLAKSSRFYKNKLLLKKADERLERLLSWQSEEGWFEEYGGFDLGYETLTFSCLIEISRLSTTFKSKLVDVIRKNASLIISCIEPDFCLGGELYARGTWNFFSHGLISYSIENNINNLPLLLKVIEARFDKYAVSVKDDYIIQHHLWSDLLSLNYLKKLKQKNIYKKDLNNVPTNLTKNIFVNKFLKDSGHLFVSHGNLKTHVSLKMGGLFRSYKNNKLIIQETQNILKVKDDFFMANSLNKEISWEWLSNNHLRIKGKLCKYKKAKMNTIKLIFLRIIMLSIGKFIPNIIRLLMQKMLINPKFEVNRFFEREFIFEKNKLKIIDRYYLKKNEINNVQIQNTSFSTFKHVVMSKIFHPYFFLINSPKYNHTSKEKNYLNIKREW